LKEETEDKYNGEHVISLLLSHHRFIARTGVTASFDLLILEITAGPDRFCAGNDERHHFIAQTGETASWTCITIITYCCNKSGGTQACKEKSEQ
jgi:hypothetical protein